jgi:hypothetical protein
MKQEIKFGTQCVHAGEAPDPSYGAHTIPIYQTSTFVFETAEQSASRFAGEEKGYIYSRLVPNTPTHAAFVEKILALEGDEAGIGIETRQAKPVDGPVGRHQGGSLHVSNQPMVLDACLRLDSALPIPRRKSLQHHSGFTCAHGLPPVELAREVGVPSRQGQVQTPPGVRL